MSETNDKPTEVDAKPTDDTTKPTVDAPTDTKPTEVDAKPAETGDTVTRAALEKLPEAMTRDELVALIRRAKLAEQIDLRLSAAKLRDALFALRPDLAPPPDPESAKLQADLEELATRAEEGDDDAAAALRELREREDAMTRASRDYAEALKRAEPALPWLAGFGFKRDPQDMERGKLLEALLAVAGSLEEPPSSIRDAAGDYLALAMASIGGEEREIVHAHREAVLRAIEAERRNPKATGPRYYTVERFAKYVREGSIFSLNAGITICDQHYDIPEMRRQGVPLVEVAPPKVGG